MSLASSFRAVLLWLGVLSAPVAVADIFAPGAGTASDLFLVLVNPISGRSEVVDLGPVADVIGQRGAWTIDRRYPKHLGPGGVTYQLVAGDLSRQGANGYAGIVLYTSASEGSGGLMTPARWGSVAIANSISMADQFLIAVAGRFEKVDKWMTFVGDDRDVTHWGPVNARPTAPGRQLGLASFDAVAPAGVPLRFYRIVAGPTDAGPAVDGRVELKGIFVLDGAKLSFTPSSLTR